MLVFGGQGLLLDFLMTGKTHVRCLSPEHFPVIGSVRIMTAHTVVAYRLMNKLKFLQFILGDFMAGHAEFVQFHGQ